MTDAYSASTYFLKQNNNSNTSSSRNASELEQAQTKAISRDIQKQYVIPRTRWPNVCVWVCVCLFFNTLECVFFSGKKNYAKKTKKWCVRSWWGYVIFVDTVEEYKTQADLGYTRVVCSACVCVCYKRVFQSAAALEKDGRLRHVPSELACSRGYRARKSRAQNGLGSRRAPFSV